VSSFSSAVSIAYYQELVKRLLSTLKICIAEVKEKTCGENTCGENTPQVQLKETLPYRTEDG